MATTEVLYLCKRVFAFRFLHILLWLGLAGRFHPLTRLPPSISITFPVMCADAALLRNNTSPAKSEGPPILPVGCLDSIVSL
jgi:hypothetical protein